MLCEHVLHTTRKVYCLVRCNLLGAGIAQIIGLCYRLNAQPFESHPFG